MDIKRSLERWQSSLMSSIPVAGLFARNPVVYKWKSLFRVWMLRETVAWRVVDLLTQSLLLHELRHSLGARILLRSSFETVATLIYLNQQMGAVVEGDVSFGDFGEMTSKLLLGSRTNPSGPKSLNIISVLEKCDRVYPGIGALYADLSESAHPSFEGLSFGYSKIDHKEFETHFRNRWGELHAVKHPDQMVLCMETFDREYNLVWPDRTTKLEEWIEANDERLEAEWGAGVGDQTPTAITPPLSGASR